MIARVDYKLYGGEIDYRLYNCNNIKEIEYKYNNRTNVLYIGQILKDTQIDMFNLHGNTIIQKSIYNKLNIKDLTNELNRILNCECVVRETRQGTIIVEKKKNIDQ